MKEKKMLPVIGQEPVAAPVAPTIRRGSTNPVDGAERTVVRVEGMDCASCAATVEKRVSRLPGMHRAVVNFSAGRLDAEHDPGLSVEEIERAVRAAGYGVGGTKRQTGRPSGARPGRS